MEKEVDKNIKITKSLQDFMIVKLTFLYRRYVRGVGKAYGITINDNIFDMSKVTLQHITKAHKKKD